MSIVSSENLSRYDSSTLPGVCSPTAPAIRPKFGRMTRKSAIGAAVVALLAGIALVGCSDNGTASSGNGFAKKSAEQMAQTVRARLELAKQGAWAIYDQNLPIADNAAAAKTTKTFVSKTSSGNVPAAFATKVISAQIAQQLSVERLLVQGWGAGQPLPTGTAPNYNQVVKPELVNLDDTLANLLVTQQPSGVPKDWADYITAAGKEQVDKLPPEIPEQDYWDALNPLKDWPKS